MYIYLCVVVVVRACVFVWETCGPERWDRISSVPCSGICRISGAQQQQLPPACTGYGSDRVDDISIKLEHQGNKKRKRKIMWTRRWTENSWFDSPRDYGRKWTAKTNKENKPKTGEKLLLARFQENMFFFFFSRIKKINRTRPFKSE